MGVVHIRQETCRRGIIDAWGMLGREAGERKEVLQSCVREKFLTIKNNWLIECAVLRACIFVSVRVLST